MSSFLHHRSLAKTFYGDAYALFNVINTTLRYCRFWLVASLRCSIVPLLAARNIFDVRLFRLRGIPEAFDVLQCWSFTLIRQFVQPLQIHRMADRDNNIDHLHRDCRPHTRYILRRILCTEDSRTTDASSGAHADHHCSNYTSFFLSRGVALTICKRSGDVGLCPVYRKEETEISHPWRMRV